MDFNSPPPEHAVCTFVIEVNNYAKPSIVLDKNPMKVVTEAKFLGVVFDRAS